jgi:hypothetical protein
MFSYTVNDDRQSNALAMDASFRVIMSSPQIAGRDGAGETAE